jgi:hypothetical protein
VPDFLGDFVQSVDFAERIDLRRCEALRGGPVRLQNIGDLGTCGLKNPEGNAGIGKTWG